MSRLYESLDAAMTAETGSAIGIRVLVCPTPFVSPQSRRSAQETHRAVHSYQRILVELWQAGVLPDELTGSPTWSAPVPDGPWKRINPEFLTPLFVRTDESVDGLIYEIQCPGSWWGSYDVLERVLRPAGGTTLAERFTQDLHMIYPDGARIMHLFESSTSPHENQYFAHRVRRSSPDFRFWGLDPDALQEHCDLVRSHSFASLVAEDMFRVRLGQLAEGRLRFDLPPIPLFDQKAPMALPFDAAYARYFSDDHRSLFPYTAFVRAGKVTLETGETLTMPALLQRDSEHRGYLLKYAGLDTTRNWGARGVLALRHLDQSRGAALVEQLRRDASAKEPWILQAEATSSGEVTFETRGGAYVTDIMNLKISQFLGPTRALGKLLQADPGPVRWNAETVLSLMNEG